MALFCEEPICLGLGLEWLECCQQYEQSELENDARFGNFITDKELAELCKGFVPKNTSNGTSWALWNFKARRKTRNSCFSDERVPPNLLQTSNKAVLNIWLSRYVETRNKNGTFYPPSTLYQLLVGILRHMTIENSSCPNFLDKRDPAFKQLHGTLDSHFRKLHESVSL